MTASARKILQEALSLPADERAVLIDELVSSLDCPDHGLDQLWAKEAQDRLRAYRHGELQAIPAEEVFAEFKYLCY